MSRPIIYETYLRKSSEPDDRQVLSIPAQKDECQKAFPDISSKRVSVESFSAKAPGRLVFNEMIERIERGEVTGLIAWHPDRLARNSVDAGRIIWLLDQGKLKDLKFCAYTFENTPEGKWMLSMIMSQAKYFVDKLSKDVKRGNRTKYNQGGITWQLGQGYMPNVVEHTQVPDPERFDLVRKMWEMLLSGGYTVPQIWRIANNDWGYRTRKTAKQGDKPLTLSLLYKIFSNPLYYGVNIRPDQTEYKCSHIPMVSEEEFWRAQAILGKKGRSRRKGGVLSPYTDSLIKCGECGCSITVDPKTKHLKNGRSIHYEYYRCTKKRGACSQRYIELKELESQVDEFLGTIAMGDNMKDWVLKYFGEVTQKEEKETSAIYKNQHRTLEVINKELFNLTVMLRKEQIDEADFETQRKLLQQERSTVQQSLNGNDYRVDKWLELAEQTFEFASQCRYWFKNGDFAQKKIILQTICGSNLTLLDRKIKIQPVGPFKVMANRVGYLSWQALNESNVRPRFWRPPFCH